MQTQAPEQLHGYEVVDSAGNRIGKVDGIWVDDATNALEFVGVKTGWLMGKTHIIPTAQAQVDDGGRTITVPYAESQIKDAPSFGTDAELSSDDENNIYSYYGVQRSTAPSPTGLSTGEQTGTYGTTDTTARDYGATDTTAGGYAATGTTSGEYAASGTTSGEYAASGTEGQAYDTTETGERRVQVAEEQLQVGKQQVEAGQVRLRKVVHTEQQEVPVELRREEVNIERVPASGQTPTDAAFQEESIDVPVMREEPVVAKEAQVTGEVRVGKTAETETRTVGGEVRKEDVEVDRDVDTGVTRSPDERTR